MRITAMLNDTRVSRSMIVDAISMDPVLSGRLLRLANSPIYALQRSISNLSAAVAAVGNQAISDSMLICGIGDSFGTKIMKSRAGREIWMHSLATALIASDLSRLARLGAADVAFSCGLLHDVGKLVMLRADSMTYTRLLDQATDKDDICSIETENYGFDHAELGYYAAEYWKLPPDVCNMIRFHHRPKDAEKPAEAVTILSIADQFVSLRQREQEIDELLESEAAKSFKFSEFQLNHIWDSMIDRLRELMRIF